MEERRTNYQDTKRFWHIYDPMSYKRIDESDDFLFYQRERFVEHLDALALRTVEDIIGSLIVEEDPVILDLMAGWDSHIPAHIKPREVVGLGLNERELSENKALTSFVIKDINRDPILPFDDNYFDVVLNTVSVDYLIRPIEVFKEVGRVLKPGGLFLVIFSNRMFPQKAIKMWIEASDDERIMIVEDYFKASEIFDETNVFVSKGKPRPSDDKYFNKCIFSDPVYAVYAEKKGAYKKFKRPEVKLRELEIKGSTDLEVGSKENLVICPHCGTPMKKWQVPDNPFCQTWENDYMYICFNDYCPYFVRGWDTMYKQTFQTMSYRCMFNPINQKFSPIPVPTPNALKEGIIE